MTWFKMARFSTAVVALALAAGTLALPSSARAFDVGPEIGTKVPDLVARDAAGAPASLRTIVGRKGVVLVFFRSAKWCPFCQAQLISLREAVAPLEGRGYRIAALSYDPPDVLAGFAVRRDISYTLLSDEGSRIIDAFSLRDLQYKPGHFAHGVPMPSIFVVGRDGTIRAKLAEESYKTRPTNEAVLDLVDRLQL